MLKKTPADTFKSSKYSQYLRMAPQKNAELWGSALDRYPQSFLA